MTTSSLDPNTSERLKRAVGPSGWTEDPREIAPHLVEWRNRWHGRTPLLLQPRTTEQVAALLAICNDSGTAVVPQGGNTGLVGGQIPAGGEILLSLAQMNQIRRVSADENLLIAEAGVILANAQKAAAEISRLLPLSLAAEGSCTIGGNVSTNAGGVHVLRYGMTRDLIMGLEVVLADGTVLDLMNGLRKDNTGYDLKQLFIGAEGTLGVITAAMLKLVPQPISHVTVMVAVNSIAAALPVLNQLQQATGSQVSAFEIIQRRALELVLREIPGTSNPLTGPFEWALLVEVTNAPAVDATGIVESTLADAIERGLASDAVFAKTLREREALWRLREAIPEAQRKQGPSVSNDISVSPARLSDFIALAEAQVHKVLPQAVCITFGHAGDGNLHFAILAPGHEDSLSGARSSLENAVNECVWRLRGSISAEHGIGVAKLDPMSRQKSAQEIRTMAAIKRALDPNNILNPGKLLPPGLA